MSSSTAPQPTGTPPPVSSAQPVDAVVEEVDFLLRYIHAAVEHPIVPQQVFPAKGTPQRAAKLTKLEQGPVGVKLWANILIEMYDTFPEALSFREPVNALSFDPPLFDYYAVIGDPMSLRTVIDSACSGSYSNTDQMKADMEKVWSNASVFNGAQSHIAKQGATCRDYLNARIIEEEDAQLATDEDIQVICDHLQLHGAEVAEQVLEYLQRVAPHMVIDGDVELEGLTRGLFRNLVHLITKGRLPTPPPPSSSFVRGGPPVGSKRRRDQL